MTPFCFYGQIVLHSIHTRTTFSLPMYPQMGTQIDFMTVKFIINVFPWFLTEGKSAGMLWHAHTATLSFAPLPEFFQSWTALISQPFITESKLHSLCPEASCLWEDLTRIPTLKLPAGSWGGVPPPLNHTPSPWDCGRCVFPIPWEDRVSLYCCVTQSQHSMNNELW